MMSSYLKIRLFPEGELGGGGEDPPATPPEEKKFTQKELEELITKRVKTLQRDNATKDKTISDLQISMQELQNRLTNLEKKDPPPDDLQGQINLLNERHRRETEAMQGKIEDLTGRLNSTTSKLKETERDKELDAALIKADCNNMKMGRRFFLPQLFYDDVDDKWMYNLDKGGTVTVEEGVIEELPDNLKKPKVGGGGSGSQTGDRRASKVANDLKVAEDTLEKLRITATRTGKPTDTAAYSKQKRVVEALRQSATAVNSK